MQRVAITAVNKVTVKSVILITIIFTDASAGRRGGRGDKRKELIKIVTWYVN